jgi:hypothetical protein
MREATGWVVRLTGSFMHRFTTAPFWASTSALADLSVPDRPAPAEKQEPDTAKASRAELRDIGRSFWQDASLKEPMEDTRPCSQ